MNITNSGYGLTIFDIDDTIFKTNNKVYVVKNNKVLKKLDSASYTTYKLRKDEQFDYREFSNSLLFNLQAKPILAMLKKIKAITKNVKKRKGSQIIMLTARKNMDNKKLFLKTFKDFGIEIDSIYIERAGNIKLPSNIAKQNIISSYLNKGIFTRVRLYDDQIINLTTFLELKKNYPEINFQAYLVKDNYIRKFNSSVYVSK